VFARRRKAANAYRKISPSREKIDRGKTKGRRVQREGKKIVIKITMSGKEIHLKKGNPIKRKRGEVGTGWA